MAEAATLPEALERTAERCPERVAVASPDGAMSLTWRQLWEKSDRLARRLHAAGVDRGDVVVVASAQWPELYVWFAALHRLGAVAAPLNLQYTPRESAEYIESLRCHGPVHLVSDATFRRPLEEVEGRHRFALRAADVAPGWELPPEGSVDLPPSPDASLPIWILATSGSMARPKPALIPHRAAHQAGLAAAGAFGATADDRLLGVLPAFHIGGLLSHVCASTIVGYAVYPQPAFDPALAYEAIGRLGITLFTAYEVITQRITSLPQFDPGSMGTIRATLGSGGQSYVDLVSDWGVEVVASGYGCTEGMLVAATPSTWPADDVRRATTVGSPTPGVELRITGEDGARCPDGVLGEIAIKGPNVFLGYVGMPETTAEVLDADGWYRTGDVGLLRDGALAFRGRREGVIKTGAENVSELEVEEFLLTRVPGVVAAAVYGIPDDHWGEIVCASVEWEAGTELTLEELRDQARGELAGFKIPRRLEHVEAGTWPVMGTGKLDKRALKERATTAR